VVTAELLYRAFGAVVSAHSARVSYIHDTNKILDRDSSVNWPACGWKLPTVGLQSAGDVYFDTYTISLLFVEQTASDRSSLEMLAAHAKMEAIAKQCFLRFANLYIHDTTAFEGVDIDLELIRDVLMTPVWDDGETMLTGVVLSFTVKAEKVECIDAYFQ